MSQEQKEIVIDNIKLALAQGLDNWWEAFVSANRIMNDDGNGGPLPADEQAQIDAWFTMFMEAHAGLIQGDDMQQFTVDMFYDMISSKWRNRADEVDSIRRLIERCKMEGVFTEEIVNCQKYGY